MATDLWRRPLQQKLLLSFTLKGWSRQTCVLRKLLPLSLYIIPPTILYIFWVASALYVEVWPQWLSGQLKKIIIMGITTTTTTTTIVLVYSYYNYIPQFVFCSIIITKILLKIIPSPPQRPRFFSHHVRVQVQGPLFVIYISRWKLLNISFLVLLVPFEHLQPKLLSG